MGDQELGPGFPLLPPSKANTLGGRGGDKRREEWTEVQNEQQRKREMGKIDKQMSARSHQLGAGILKQNV